MYITYSYISQEAAPDYGISMWKAVPLLTAVEHVSPNRPVGGPHPAFSHLLLVEDYPPPSLNAP